MRRFVVLAILAALAALPALAQVPTGTLSGHVTDGTNALPGVTVTSTSPALQGARSAVTSANGDYIFAFLPPGEYRVKFELQGFQTLDTTIKINAAQTQKLDATMPASKITEEVTVTGSSETISTNAGASTTVSNSLVEKLPVTKDITTQVALTPGVTQNGPNNAITIAGAPSYDNNFLINGVSVTENLRGTPIALYIEDAVEETTTSISSVSAEFGRFNGGVVNTLTKSGGNEFHATARDTLNNDKWTAKTPRTTTRTDKVTNTWEGTLGGFILKDKLWFFLAGRQRKTDTNDFTVLTDLPIPYKDIDKRGEAKLTFSPTPDHRLMYDYNRYQFAATGFEFSDPADLNTGIAPDITNNLKALNYTGVLSDNFFVNGQYSYRTEAFYHYGCPYSPNVDESIIGTPIIDLYYGTQANCSIFASNKGGPGTRNAEDVIAKGSWFLSTAGAGSHDIVFGVDQYKDMARENNYQSSSDFTAYSYGYQTSPDGRTIYPTFYNFFECQYCSWWVWWPVVELSKGNELRTESAFINDKWRLNNNWSFNLGVRYDRNHAKNQAGLVTAKDSAVSPRLAITWDPKGDGEWIASVGYGKYVGAQQQNFLDSNTSAGAPATYQWVYTGDTINGACDPADPVATGCLDSQQARAAIWAWFNAQGGTANKGSLYTGEGSLAYAQPAGLFPIITNGLRSPSTDEWSASLSKRFGSTGMLRFDYINRKLLDMYENTTTGVIVDDGLGDFFDQTGLINAPSWLFQKYWAYILSGQFQPWQPLTIGGNYTYSRSYGNLGGLETSGHGPTGNSSLSYPEFADPKWNSPVGDTTYDQRNRVRLYFIYDILNTKHHRLSASLLQSYYSGQPYGANGSVASIDYVDPALYSGSNPKYVQPPFTVGYWYTSRNQYHWQAINRTDIGLDYSFHVPMFGSDVELYVNPRIQNAFNKQAVISGNTTVNDATTSSAFAPFDPFTTPTNSLIECPQGDTAAQCSAMGANWQKGSRFGQATRVSDYQTPRRFFIALGIRF